ncbi:hypothetical protein DNTS_026857, partial [Danionella cerebrum]
VQSNKKSGIPAPREIPQSISRERLSLRDQQKCATTKKMVTSASASSLSTLTKHSRVSAKTKSDSMVLDKTMLESQVRELLAEAKTKEFEISKLRMELQRYKGKDSSSEAGTPEGRSEKEKTPTQTGDFQVLVGELREKNGRFQRELAFLREENQDLKQKLITLEALPSLVINSHSVNGVYPESMASDVSSGSHILISDTKGSPLPSSNSTGSSEENKLSVESLKDRIQKMEECHHSTAEELQATLQELADQQQVVQELTAENERLAEERGLLQTSLQQQRERVELLTQQNDSLLQRLRDQTQSQEIEASRASRLEERLAAQVDSSRFEREKLVDIQQQLTGSLRSLEKESHDAQAAVTSLKEQLELLQGHLEKETQIKDEALRKEEEQRQVSDAMMVENISLKSQLEVEKQKLAELKAVQNASDNTELQSLLKIAHEDQDKLEVTSTELQQELQRMATERLQLLAKLEKQEQDHEDNRLALDEKSRDAENQIKDLKETIFELEDQVEQQRAVRLHTNQSILDLESQIRRLEENKAELEKQIKAMNKQMKEESEEWRRFQADLQTAVVVANDIKVEAQQELRTLHRRLQEEQEHSARLALELENIHGTRSWNDDESPSDSDSSPHWCRMSVSQNAPVGFLGSLGPSEPAASVQTLIKSCDSTVQKGSSSMVQLQSSPRSPLSSIPVRTPPAAAVSPIQRHSGIKPPSKGLERRMAFGDFPHNGSCEELKTSTLMRKSPSLESVIRTPALFNGRSASFTYSRVNSKLNVERTDPLSALAREYGGSKRNALLKWCQKKTEGYPLFRSRAKYIYPVAYRSFLGTSSAASLL